MHKQSLRALLKDLRAQIKPEDVGLPPNQGRGRRAEGLSQQQVDLLINRGGHAYHLLETGKMPNPSHDLLRNVAELFRMDEHEWIILHRYALDQHPPGPLRRESGYHVPATWQTAVRGIEHMAYVSDAAWNVLAHNDAWTTMFVDGVSPANTLRWMCLDPVARNVTLTDWETMWAPRVLPQLRAAVAARRDPQLELLEKEVLEDPVARKIYRTATTNIHPDGQERPLNHATLGPGWITMCSAQPEGSPGARLMILLFQPGPRIPGPRDTLHAPTP